MGPLSEVHRVLHLTSPMVTGPDVRALQEQVNEELVDHGLPWRRVDVDGELGPRTVKSARLDAFVLGLAKGELERIGHGRIGLDTQRLLRHPERRNSGHRAAARRRESRVEKRRQAHRRSADDAVRWALAQRGIVEQPYGSNRGAQIDVWQRAVDMLAQPWCGAFTHYASKFHGGATGLTWRVRYTPFTLEDARLHRNGFAGLVAKTAARAGDHALFNFSGGSLPQHTGLVVKRVAGGLLCIEGNTSSGNSGSQSNGGGVFLRTRPDWSVVGVARPNYNR